MQKKISFSALLLLGAVSLMAQTKTDVLDDALKIYGGKWPKTLSFIQTTTLFRPEGQTEQTWYEAGSLPEKFRIDFDREKGNLLILDGDKEFYFKEHKLVRTGANHNPLIYLLGGMYFDTIDSVKAKLSKLGVDIKAERMGTWKGKEVRIVGSKDTATMQTQLWFDAKELYLVRFIQNPGTDHTDIHFSGQKKIKSTWHEMFVEIYRNGKLIQTEQYRNFKTNIKLDQGIFDPAKAGKIHWSD